jgi:hypothetical protein
VSRQSSSVLPAAEQPDVAGRLLGLPGFAVLAVAKGRRRGRAADRDGRLGDRLPVCGVVAVLHDRKPRLVRDLPLGGRPAALVWFKRVWWSPLALRQLRATGLSPPCGTPPSPRSACSSLACANLRVFPACAEEYNGVMALLGR